MLNILKRKKINRPTLIVQVYVDLNPLLLPQAGHRPASFSESINMTVSATGQADSSLMQHYFSLHPAGNSIFLWLLQMQRLNRLQ